MIPVVVIFDVGKTHKKIFLFDEDYEIRFERSVELPETVDEDGFPCEDLGALSDWLVGSLDELISSKKYAVQAVNISAYGASLVYVDAVGRAITPLYNYLKPYPEALSKQFYETYGGEPEVSRLTASPPSGSLNSGLQLYRIKYESPAVFEKISCALHLPQFLSFLLTGKTCSNIASVGCHTCLWDFAAGRYHRWVTEERVFEKLAPDIGSGETARVKMENLMVAVGSGLHDSSAALIPYLEQFQEPFILLSTGTWNIAMNPFNHESLTARELDKDCLCYLSYKGKAVKASRLFAGLVHQQQTNRIAEYFHQRPGFHNTLAFDESLTRKSGTAAEPKDLTAGKFFTHDLSIFSSEKEAYHALLSELAAVQCDSLSLILQPQTTSIFIDGGFSQNGIFMELLKKAFPKLEVRAAFVPQASAIGAAMAIHSSWNKKEMKRDIVKLR